jgi:hypothetical protein
MPQGPINSAKPLLHPPLLYSAVPSGRHLGVSPVGPAFRGGPFELFRYSTR